MPHQRELAVAAKRRERGGRCRVVVQGPGPSARYAHTLALVANRFLVAMGGNDGKQTLGDAWALDTSDKPYQWRKITDAGETPAARCTPTSRWRPGAQQGRPAALQK